MELLELAVLAIASAFWPTLIAVDLVALRTSRPVPLLAWFLAAGLLTTIVEGVVIVFALEGTALGSRSHRSLGGWGNLIGGAAALLVAYLLRAHARRRPRPPAEKHAAGSWTERVVARGGAYAFGAGVVLNLFPGVVPLLALANITALDYGDGTKALLVVGFYICMFVLVEAPLLGLLLAPERVDPAVRRLNAALDRNARRVAIDALLLVGAFLVVRGVIVLATG
jgi:hypothetical protein